MASQAFIAQPTISQPVYDEPLAESGMAFDAKLYLPEIPGPLERTIHLCSVAAGPITFVAALAGVIAWIV